MPGGEGWAVSDPKKFSEPRSGNGNFFCLLGGSGGMLPWKIFKIRLSKNAFPDLF